MQSASVSKEWTMENCWGSGKVSIRLCIHVISLPHSLSICKCDVIHVYFEVLLEKLNKIACVLRGKI